MSIIACIAAGYAIVSYIFFTYPLLLHTQKKQKFRAVHISHRGGAGERYENTLGAFRHAVSLGTDMLELDCVLTADGHVIVSHDNDLQRLTGSPVTVSNLRLDELPLLSYEMEVQFSTGTYYVNDEADRKFALLEDVFRQFPNVAVNIDIKENDDLLIEKVSALVRQYDREHLTAWGNKDQRIVNKCYRANPNIGLIFSLRRVMIVLVCYYLGLLPFLPLKEEYFEVPMPSLIKPYVRKHSPGRFKELLVDIIDMLMMRPSLFKHLRKRGIQTYIWVLNSEDLFHRAFNVVGADGVMTDYPTSLRLYLQQNHSSWRPRGHDSTAS